MDFYLFRVSLLPQQNLFSSGESRQQWLRRVFSAQRSFSHRNTKFTFVPETRISHGNLLFGWVARQKSMAERTAPDEGLEVTQHEYWQAAFVIIDPTEHPDGQKIAMEESQQIGRSSSVLSSLLKAATENATDAPYVAQVYTLTEEHSFWTFVEEHGARIKSITFDVSAPNMFNDRNDFQDEMRRLRDNENVSRVTTTLESNTVINTDSARLRDIVDYTERGAGELSAEAEDGQAYHSGEHPKKMPVNVEPHTRNVAEFLRQIAAFLDGIVG